MKMKKRRAKKSGGGRGRKGLPDATPRSLLSQRPDSHTGQNRKTHEISRYLQRAKLANSSVAPDPANHAGCLLRAQLGYEDGLGSSLGYCALKSRFPRRSAQSRST